MKYFSLKKYVSIMGFYIFGFLCTVPLAVVGAIVDNDTLKNAFVIIMPLSVCLFLLPCVYYLYLYLYCKKKADGLARNRGKVSNWEAGFMRHLASVSIIIEDKEFSTPQYFNHEDARSLVGKEIEYCIIDDILFIFSVQE